MADPEYTPTPPQGLAEAEAARRHKQGMGNKAPSQGGKSTGQIIASHLLTFFNLLNIGIAVALALVGAYRNMLFLGVVVCNCAIGIIQELRARRTIRQLQVLNAPRAAVLRDGVEKLVSPEELVLGDLVVLRAGDQVVADGVIRSGRGAANESLLTGESDDVSKEAGDWLMSGSYVTEGRITMQLLRVGADSYAHQLTAEAKQIKRPKSQLLTEIRTLIKIDSMLLIPLGLLQFSKQYWYSGVPLQRAVSSAAAAMIGMIPEGLVLLTSMALTVGVLRLGKRNTLVQELYGIEALARVDTLCLDKTGTLTTGEMAVTEVYGDEALLRASLSRFLGAFETRSATLKALADWTVPGSETPDQVLPFSSQRKSSAAAFGAETLFLGAPEFLMESLPAEAAAWQNRAAELGWRVLALARAEGPWQQGQPPAQRSLLGLIALRDCLRPHVEETLGYFTEQGVRLVLISGDSPRTVSSLARQVRFPNADAWVDASTLKDEDIPDACERYAVFGRVSPAQKKALVQALQAKGHTVAMTGDGVNDIPALKTADCSIAMAGGSNAAKHAAMVSLLDADFSSLPAVVAEGRRVVNNITRAATLFLVKTIYSLGLSFLTLFLPVPFPFQPIQLSLISSCTIGFPSFLLALEPNRDPVQGHFLRTVITRALPGGIAVTLCGAVSMLMIHAGWPMDVCSTLATLSAGCVGLMELWLVCHPFSKLRLGVFVGMSVLFFLAVHLIGGVFYLVPLNTIQVTALVGLTLFAALILWIASLIPKFMNPKRRLQA